MEKSDLYIFGITGSKGEILPKEWGWEYCKSNRIPYILSSLKEEAEYSNVSIDLDTLHDGLFFKDQRIISDKWKEFYFKYRDKTNLPDDKGSYVGSNTSFSVTIWSKDVIEFSTSFSKYILEIVKKNGSVDLFLAEYTKINRHINQMMNGELPFNEKKRKELDEKLIGLRYKIWDKDFKRITNYESGRIIPFE